MKVLVDVTTWIPGRTGIGLYTERLLRAWLSEFPNDQLIFASNTDFADLHDVKTERVGTRFPIRAAWLQTFMAFHALRLRPDIAFFPNYMAPISMSIGCRRCPMC